VRGSSSSTPRFWPVACGILLLALSLRLGWGLSRPSTDEFLSFLPDQVEYLSLGRSLLEGRGLALVDPRYPDEVHAYRMPGYPAWIALFGGNVRAVRASQALLDTSTVLATMLLAARFLGARLAVVAGLLTALNPYLIYFSGTILTETLYTAVLTWGLFLLSAGIGSGRWWAGLVLLAAGVHVRPSSAGLVVALSVVSALLSPRTSLGRRIPPAGATAIILVGLSLFPWAVRNHRLLGEWVWTTTNRGITAYDGLHPDATGASDQSFVRKMPELRDMTELARDRWLLERAGEFARRDPGRVLRLGLVKIGRTWSPVPLSAEHSGWKTRTLAAAYTVPLFALAVCGILRNRLGLAEKSLLLAPAVYFTLVHAVSVGSLRYRVPCEPPIAVLAASALTRGGGSRGEQGRREVAGGNHR
jgi:4-amino-4-deoxy-L-arabinose transferase-like glycosyltransferase